MASTLRKERPGGGEDEEDEGGEGGEDGAVMKRHDDAGGKVLFGDE